MHPHRDLDIFIMPLAGVVEHRDSLGHHAFVRPGQVQRMVAGRGRSHGHDRVIPLAAGDALAVDRAGARPLRIESEASAWLLIFEFASADRG